MAYTDVRVVGAHARLGSARQCWPRQRSAGRGMAWQGGDINNDKDRTEMTDIEKYALKIVADYAEGGIEDDMDEDEELASGEDWEAAIGLALAIVAGIRANPQAVLALAVPKGQK